MIAQFDLSGTTRRELAEAISEILGVSVRYMGMPTANYEVGNFTITRTGELVCENAETCFISDDFWDQLVLRGFSAITVDTEEGLVLTNAPLAPDDRIGMIVSMPRDGFTDAAIDNLKKIIASKESLIKKSLGVDSLPLYDDGDKLHFPWFIMPNAEAETLNPGDGYNRYDAYSCFIEALCDMAMRQKRVVAKEREVVNEKFAMRVFLIRLGFIGPKYKSARMVLLRNLSGNSAWKYGAPTRPINGHHKNAL